MTKHMIFEQALREAKRQQAASGEHTAAWFLWEAHIQAMEHRLRVSEVQDKLPNSIPREDI